MTGFICKRLSACAEQKPPCRAQPGSWHGHIPRWTNSRAGWTLSPLNGLRKMVFLKQTRAGNRQEQSPCSAQSAVAWVLITSQFQILFRKHILDIFSRAFILPNQEL